MTPVTSGKRSWKRNVCLIELYEVEPRQRDESRKRIRGLLFEAGMTPKNVQIIAVALVLLSGGLIAAAIYSSSGTNSDDPGRDKALERFLAAQPTLVVPSSASVQPPIVAEKPIA